MVRRASVLKTQAKREQIARKRAMKQSKTSSTGIRLIRGRKLRVRA